MDSTMGLPWGNHGVKVGANMGKHELHELSWEKMGKHGVTYREKSEVTWDYMRKHGKTWEKHEVNM